MPTWGPHHRKRCKRWDHPWDAHYLTFSCFARRPFFTQRASRWFLDALDRARHKQPFELWGFAIMPEHVHLLLLPHEGVRISAILLAIKQPVAKRAVLWVRRNRPDLLHVLADRQPGGKTSYRFWQRGGGYDRNLRSIPDVHEKLHYLHEDPVRRGLAQSVADWEWSSWRAWEEGIDEPIAIDRDTFPVSGPE